VDEFSSILDVHGAAALPVGAITLIGLGVLLLLNTMDVIRSSATCCGRDNWPLAFC